MIGINGVPEILIAGILTAAVGKVLMNQKVRTSLGI